jgi:hypothetical protein
MAIPALLEKELRRAVEGWKQNEPATVDDSLKKAATLAKTIGYL